MCGDGEVAGVVAQLVRSMALDCADCAGKPRVRGIKVDRLAVK
jgi:hypothetical protein